MILLSFDIEEFDMPFEYKANITFEEQIKISQIGTEKILALLKKHNIKATFFSTVTFALNTKELIKKIIDDGHEIASHSYYHSQFEDEHYLSSKKILEEITKTEVIGFRMPRMKRVNNNALQQAGYKYNSSINPTYLPGRYNNFKVSRTYFKTDKLLQIPASVTPVIRFPLFWLSFHNLPLWLYKLLCKWTLNKDAYLDIYFHPWEFMPLKNKYNFPTYVCKNDNGKMLRRMDKFITYFKHKRNFITFKEFLVLHKS